MQELDDKDLCHLNWLIDNAKQNLNNGNWNDFVEGIMCLNLFVNFDFKRIEKE